MILLFLHLLGMATLFSAFIGQIRAAPRRLVPAYVHGALTQLVTGVLLVFVRGDAPDVDEGQTTVKSLVLLAIITLLWANRRRDALADGAFFAIGGLTVLNVAVAVFWT